MTTLGKRALASAAAVAALIVVWPEAHSGPRDGEVVRVERGTAAKSGLRACMRPGSTAKLACFGGPQPVRGERISVVNMDGTAEVVRVLGTKPSSFDRCGLGSMYDVDIDGSRARQSRGYQTAFGVRGLDASLGRAKIVTDHSSIRNAGGIPPKLTIWFAIDLDGNGKADVVGAHSECSEAKNGAPAPRAGRTISSLCLDYYRQRGGTFVRVNRDLFYSCF